MLCGACQGIWKTIQASKPGSWNGPKPTLFEYPELEDAWGGAHHIALGAFLTAIKQKCYICSTIYRDFRPQLRKQAFRFRFFYQLRLTQGDPESSHNDDHFDLKFTVEVLDGEAPIAKEQVIECGGIFKILPATEIPNIREPLGLTDDTFSAQCKWQVQQWLDKCKKSHKICNQNWSKSNFPSRLLKIDEAKGLFRLELIEDNMKCPSYVTLSHCWEADMPVKLSELTVDNFLQGVAVQILPRKFQDAMSIAVWMEIEYIWIDALCIFQDSEEDWTMESIKMGDIYTKSHCNIAATGAGPDRGCFTRRYTEMVEPYTIQNPRSGNEAPTHLIGYNDFWSNSLLDTRLHNRGWVLQERLLSPRTIHFGQEQIFWECRCQLACEAYPEEVPQQFCNWKTRAWRQSDKVLTPQVWHQSRISQGWTRFLGFFGASSRENWSEVHSVWSKTVERYMECRLSCSEDKLVAISGMAQKIAAITNQKYLAGLWEDSTLPQSLLWYVLGRRQADTTPSYRVGVTEPQKYRAPSWSWASLEAKVIWNWPVPCEQILVTIFRTHIEEVKAGSKGRVNAANMEVSGVLMKAMIKVMSNGVEEVLEEDGGYILSIESQTEASSDSAPDSVHRVDIEPIIYLDTPLLPRSPTAEIWMLPVCSGWQGRSGNVPIVVAGLLLQKSYSSTSKNVFTRSGIFGLDKDQIDAVCGSSADQRHPVERFLADRATESITIE